jgi:hypothetical protein
MAAVQPSDLEQKYFFWSTLIRNIKEKIMAMYISLVKLKVQSIMICLLSYIINFPGRRIDIFGYNCGYVFYSLKLYQLCFMHFKALLWGV